MVYRVLIFQESYENVLIQWPVLHIGVCAAAANTVDPVRQPYFENKHIHIHIYKSAESVYILHCMFFILST